MGSEAEARVREKWPDAYCNHWLNRGRLLFFISTGVYEEQKRLGQDASTPEWAWQSAASRLSEVAE